MFTEVTIAEHIALRYTVPGGLNYYAKSRLCLKTIFHPRQGQPNVKLGYYDKQSATITDLFDDADDTFFLRYCTTYSTLFTRICLNDLTLYILCVLDNTTKISYPKLAILMIDIS